MLLTEAERRGPEGVVSKKRDGANLAGERCGWRKVKTAVESCQLPTPRTV
jgi:hypothetical protein